MRSDNVVRLEAMSALVASLGAVDAERFICMVKRDTFDYTEWQRNLWSDKSIEEIHAAATEHEKIKQAEYSAQTLT
jgi:hypothetical protein